MNSTSSQRKLFLIVTISLIFLVTTGSGHNITARQLSKGHNLALGRPCRYSPAPNYNTYCKDPNIGYKLTDSQYNGCRWTDKGTVGWIVGRNRVIYIDLDLGAAYPIGEVTFDTITGLRAQVTFPAAVLVFLSSDGQQYRYLGDVLAEYMPQNKLPNHRFALADLKGWGRFVRLAIIPDGFYVFSDEIEIIEGVHTEKEAAYLDSNPILSEQVGAYATGMIDLVKQKNTTLALLRGANEAIDNRATGLRDGDLINEARKLVNDGRKKVLTSRVAIAADYALGPPYRPYELPVFETIARLNSKIFSDGPLLIWQDDHWGPLHYLDVPLTTSLGATVSVDMMNNEWATGSFIVTSASAKALALTVSAEDFEGPATVSADKVLKIQHVVHVEAYGNRFPDDAIVPQAYGPIILAPGISKRIWLTFNTRGMDLKPGAYFSNISVKTGDEKLYKVPIKLVVWPLRFPDKVALQSNTWAYFEGPIAGLERAAAQDLQDHYNTSLTIHHGFLPYPKIDNEGKFIEPLDFSKLDEVLAWNPGTRLWLLWPGFEFGFRNLGGAIFGSAVWERVFAEWTCQIRDHMLQKGIDKNQFAWYWIDEPNGKVWDEVCVPASALLKKIDPEMLVWANPASTVNAGQLKNALPYFDIYCFPQGRVFDRGIRDICGQTRLESWFYGCASDKNSDPFASYRWFSWAAWRMGLGGIGMWVYADQNSVTFSDYNKGVSYGMIYRKEGCVMASKRWEAWRQGIADFEYLRMLRDAVLSARKANIAGTAIDRAEFILSHAVADVVGTNSNGGDSSKRSLPDFYKNQILKCLAELHIQNTASISAE